MQERLQKILSAAGVASRRKAEEMIAAGRVAVNGTTISTLGAKFSAATDNITVDGKKISAKKAAAYYLLNKPKGYISTVSDERGRKTILDLLPKDRRIYPIGRLDCQTEGLLLVTDDGRLTNALLHPRFATEKTYVATIDGEISAAAVASLQNGVKMEGDERLTAPAKVRVIYSDGAKTKIELTIHEGRNRQVRRMLAAVGHKVTVLKRTRLAFLTLDGVKRGQWRELTADEVKKLYETTGLTK